MTTYRITAPNGKTYQIEGPPGASQEDVIRAVLAQAPEAGRAPPETTFLGQTKEAFKGLIPGAVGLVESAAIGASALLPEEQERAAREAIARVAGAAKAPFAPAPGYEESIPRKVTEAVGSTVPFLLAGPLGWAGRLGAVGLGVGAGAGEARTRAEAEGATEEQRGTATALGTIPGALEVFAPFRILSRIPEGEVLTAAAKVKRVLQAAGEEAAQEAASGLAQNMIARGVYKPDQALIEGLGEQAAYGGATGAIVQGLMDLALGRRARGAGAGAPEGPPGELLVERLRREQAAEIAAKAEAKREPINRAQTVIDETLAQPITEAYPRLTQEIETLKQQPESKERNAAIRELEAERARRQREDTERARAGKRVAEGFLTAEEAAAQGVTPREEFDPTEARREEIARLRAQREDMLVKGKPPAPKSPARRKFDELDARLVEIGGGRWTPTLPPPTATEPTTPTVEEPTVRGPAPLPDVLDSATIKAIGFTRGKIHDALVGKSITDPEIRTILEDAKERTTSSKTAAKIDAFVARLPEPITLTVEAAPVEPPPPEAAAPTSRTVEGFALDIAAGKKLESPEDIQFYQNNAAAIEAELNKLRGAAPVEPTTPYGSTEFPAAEAPTAEAAPAPITETPSAPSIPTEPERIGAGVPVAGGPAAVSPAEGVGAAEPVRVVPSVEDAGRPVAGEGQQPAAVSTTNTPESDALMDEIRALEQQRMALLTKNGRVPAAKTPARKKYDELVDTIAQKKEQWAQMTRPQRGPVEAVETPAPTEPTDLTPEQRADLAEEVERISGRMSQGEYDAYVEEHVDETGDRIKPGAKHINAARELVKKYGGDTQYRTVPQSPVVTDRISDAELNKIVSDIEKALGGKLGITVLDDVTDVDNKQAPGSRAGALIKGQIYLFRSGIAKGIEGQKTIFHEVFHKGLRNLTSPAEYRALMTKLYNQSAAVRQAADTYLASTTGKKDTKDLSPQDAQVLAVEESLAEMAEQTNLTGSTLRQLGNFFARLADRFGMPDLARAIRTMGMDPLQSFIREAIQAGIRPSVGEGVTRFRPGTPAFDRWFGNSKVVDTKGKPKVMYHGTARDITGFRAKQAGAIFVTEDPRFAAGFSEMSQSWMLNNYQSILTGKQIEDARNAVPRILKQEGYKGAEAASLQRQIDNNAPTGAAQAIWEAALKEQMPTGPNIMPLYVKAENPFDYQNENHLARLRAWDYQNRYNSIPGSRNQVINMVNVGNGGWSSIEDPRTQKAIRDLGFDGFYIKEGGLKNLAVYSPNQIKSATGNVGAYGQRPITKEEAQRFGMTEEQAAEAQAAGDIRFRTAPEPERPGALVGERTEATAGDAIGRTLGERKTIGLRAQATDSLAGVEAEMGNLYGNSIRDNSGNMNPTVLLSRALDAPRFAQEMLRVGTIVVDPSGLSRITELDYNGQKISFEGVLRDIAAEAKRRGQTPAQFVKEFGEVLAGRREYELMKDNDAREVKLEFYLTPEEAEAANEKFNNDAFIKDASAKMDAIRFAGLDFLVATGRMSKDKAKEWKEATAYTPFKRIEELDKFYVSQGQGGVSTNFKLAAFKQMKEFKGSSERQTENPIENFVGLMEWMTREGMKAEAVGRALRDLELVGAAKYLPRGRDQMPQSQKGAVVSSWQKGQEKFYYVPDPANLAAFVGAKSMQIGSFMRAAQSFSQVLRVGVTITPAFIVKQIADDITRGYVHSGVNNPMELIPRILSNMPRNWWNEVKGTRSPGVAKLAQHGVVSAYDTVQGGNVRSIFEETGISKRSLGRAILRILEAGAKASDVSVRQAIYEQTMKETGDVALAESRAREIINFSRRGASTTADFFIRTIPFFNAYARSMDKLLLAAGGGKTVGVSTGYARNLFFKRMGVLTAMGFSYALLMFDDEEYQNLSDHVRDRNWVLPYGKELGFTPVIPVPPELSFFFKAIPERVVQYYKLQGTPEERDALRVARELMLSGVDIFWAPNLTPQLVKPFFENMVNYSFFLGRPLESQSQLRLDASRRFGTGTSEAVKAAAEALAQRGIELSPIKIENAIRGVFGMSAGLALSVADVMVNPTRTDRPLHQHLAAQLTGASAFMKDPVGTRFLDDMYDFEDKVAQAYNTYNNYVKTAPEKADAYLLQNYGRYSVYEATKAVMESIRDLNNEAQVVDRAKDIPPDERRQIMNTLRAQQNELAQISYALRRQAQINQAEIDLR